MQPLKSILDYALQLAGHPLVQIALGMTGILVGIYQIVIATAKRRLCFRVSEYPWERAWAGQEVKLKVALWNGGRLPIVSSDIGYPITINSPSGSHAIAARITTGPGPGRDLRVRLDSDNPGSVAVEFHYLDPGDGGVLELSFVGKADMRLAMGGAIIGRGKLLQVTPWGLGSSAYVVALLVFSWVLFFTGVAALLTSRILGLALMTVGAAFYPAVIGPALRLRRKLRMPEKQFPEFEKRPRSAQGCNGRLLDD